jgi:hypothetical protein
VLAAAPVRGAERIVPADRALMDRVLAESGVERVAVPPETSYLGELFRAAQRAVLDALLRGSEMLSLPREAVQWMAGALVVLAVLLLARALLSRRRRRGREEPGSTSQLGAAPAAWDAAAWRAELERRLGDGRIAEALEALWWWLARSVAGEKAERDWTGRDLVARARREDLRELVRRLDAFTYGPRRPAVEDLRRLLGRLEEALS